MGSTEERRSASPLPSRTGHAGPSIRLGVAGRSVIDRRASRLLDRNDAVRENARKRSSRHVPIPMADDCTDGCNRLSHRPCDGAGGFWGYGRVMLEEKFRPPVAILILSVLFAVGPHPPVGSPLWPRLVFYFLTSITFGTMALVTNSILPGLVVHIIGDLTFFTLVWPHDPVRPLVGETGTDAWLWLRVVQAIVFTALAVLAFVQLARVARPVRAAVLDGY